LAENGEKRNVALVAMQTQPFRWMERSAARMVHATFYRRSQDAIAICPSGFRIWALQQIHCTLMKMNLRLQLAERTAKLRRFMATLWQKDSAD